MLAAAMLRACIQFALFASVPACAVPVEIKKHYPDGARRAEGNLLRSKQHGMWRQFWPNGQKKAEGRYVDDVQVGRWTWWYDDGQLRCSGSFEAEHRVGSWCYWHPSGQLHMTGCFEGGRKEGRWEARDAGGELLELGEYCGGKRVGPWTFRTVKGQVQGWFDSGRPVGAWRHAQDGGAPRVVNHPWPTAMKHVQEVWSSGVTRRAGVTVRGVRQGRWFSWHENGAWRCAVDFVDGEARGVARVYDSEHRLMAFGPVRSGRVIGTWQLRERQGFVAHEVDPGRPPGVFAGRWAPGEKFDLMRPLQQAETGLQELASAEDAKAFLRLPDAPSGTVVRPRAEIPAPRPVPTPETFFTHRELRDLGDYVLAYTRELATEVFGDYESRPTRKDAYASTRLTGRKIEARLRAPEGKDVEIPTGSFKGWTLLVLLRGYAGQVCPYCPMQMRALAPFRKELTRLGVRVVCVYPGPIEGVRGFQRAYAENFGAVKDPPYEVYYDVDSNLPRELDLLDKKLESGVLARPSTFILDPAGKIRWAYVGRHRADRPAAENLLKTLERLLR